MFVATNSTPICSSVLATNSTCATHEVLAGAVSKQLVLKEPGKKFVSASNERHLSGDTGTILEYTNVTGPNQSGLSWD